MTWNHRVLAHENDGELYFKIHEVHYDMSGKAKRYTKNPVPVGGGCRGGIEWVLNKMKECLSKPVLWAGDRFPEECNKFK